MSSNNDDTILPTRRPLNSGGIDGDTVLPSQNATCIHTPGDVIDNRYTVVREIGRGGMGVVYEVEDAITGDHYAVKRLLPAFASRPEILQQFRTEGAASIRFTNQSRYFVSTQTVGLDDGHPYIVMQLVRYPTLRNRLDASGGSLRTEEALPVLMEIAEGLAELHSLGYIHRDLKPDNVFIHQQASDVHVMLVDFGLTKYGSDATATALGGVGTERYASPEQKKGLPTTATSDIYSFGVVAFEVLTGELPGVGDQVTDYTVGVPPEVASIIMQCLSTRPERRPKDGGALRAAMIGSTPAESPLPQVAVAITAPKSPPTKLSSSLRFPDLQVGAKVVIDGESLAVGRDYRCELDEGTTKSVAVVVTWEGVDLFRDSVVLRAGDSKAIPTRKAYRIDCDVPDWCEVKDAKGQRVVFPILGLLTESAGILELLLNYNRKVFGTLIVGHSVGQSDVSIEYRLSQVTLTNVPNNCQARVNGEIVSDKCYLPIAVNTSASAAVRVYGPDKKEVYFDSITVTSGENKIVDLAMITATSDQASVDLRQLPDTLDVSQSTAGHSKKKYQQMYFVVGVVLFVLVSSFIYTFLPSTSRPEENTVTINGLKKERSAGPANPIVDKEPNQPILKSPITAEKVRTRGGFVEDSRPNNSREGDSNISAKEGTSMNKGEAKPSATKRRSKTSKPSATDVRSLNVDSKLEPPLSLRKNPEPDDSPRKNYRTRRTL